MKKLALSGVILASFALSVLAGNPFVAYSTKNAGAAFASSPRDIVAFNTANHKFHDLNCIWAQRCTVHCIPLTRAEAHNRGGVPCKVCSGGE